MSFCLDQWMKQYVNTVDSQFGNRVWFIGLQGSYGRDEADENSDIDVVLILDHISVQDLEYYSCMLDKLPYREKICGFVSGKEELLSWEPSDLFQFYYDTTPVYGSLDDLLCRIHEDDIIRAIHLGACNIYHMCVHNLLHEKSPDILKNLYKSAAFTLQAIAFLNTERYERKKEDLLDILEEADQHILRTGMTLRKKRDVPSDELLEYSRMLIDWSSRWIKEVYYG